MVSSIENHAKLWANGDATQEPATPTPKTRQDHIDLSAIAADPLLLGVWC